MRPVNRLLGKKPKLAFIEASQVIPTLLIFCVSILLGAIFSLSLENQLIVFLWLVSTWWGATGRRPWRLLSNFISKPNWTRGYARNYKLSESLKRGRRG